MQFFSSSAIPHKTFPKLTWVDGSNKGEFNNRDVIHRSSAVAAVFFRRLLVRLDLRGKETKMFDCEKENE